MTGTMKWLVIAVSVAAGVLGLTPPPAVEAAPTPHMRFGMVGIVQGQTARLNLVSIAPDSPDRTCVAELAFLDGAGMVVASSTERLAPGQAVFLDFGLERLDIRPGQRVQLRALVRFVVPDVGDRGARRCQSDPSAAFVGTVEVFDNETGQTMVILPAVQK